SRKKSGGQWSLMSAHPFGGLATLWAGRAHSFASPLYNGFAVSRMKRLVSGPAAALHASPTSGYCPGKTLGHNGTIGQIGRIGFLELIRIGSCAGANLRPSLRILEYPTGR